MKCDANDRLQATDKNTAPAASAERIVVLYVEDNSVCTLIVEEAVRRCAAIHLRTAASLAAAEASVCAVPPCVVLLDMQLGDAHGSEAFWRLKSIPGMHEVPFVALTADAFAQSRAQALALGFADYWCKPINVASLADDIIRAAGQSPHRSSI